MYFLSNYILSPFDRRKLRCTDTYSLHRIVYSLFDKSEEVQPHRNILFSEKLNQQGLTSLYILSNKCPNQPVYGKIRIREFPNQYLNASQYAFRITINPTKKESKSGKIISFKNYQDISSWFCNHSPSWGFKTYESLLQVENIHVVQFKKEKHLITLAKAQISGHLEVTDRELFEKSFYQGIGRAKAFGCGLLQLFRYQ